MKIRFPAALLLAALFLSGCAAQAAAPAPTQPVLTVIEEPAVPLAPATEVTEAPVPTAPPAPMPTEAPAATEPAPAPTEAPVRNTQRLTKDEAIAIALKDAGFTADQVSRLRAEFDYDDGRPEYDVDFRQGGYEYDYEIHAETGKILSREKERED